MNTKASDPQAVLKSATEAAKQVSAATQALRTRRVELVDTQNELNVETANIYRQRLRRDDVKALALLAIDRWGEEFLQSWAPVLGDFAAPRGPRPQTLDAQNEARRSASERIERAQNEVNRIERHLRDQHQQHSEANAKAERGEAYERPKIAMMSPEELDKAKAVLLAAKRSREALDRPGTVNLQFGKFEKSSAPMMVQDAAVILDGGHTRLLASSDGADAIDHMRNIFHGVRDNVNAHQFNGGQEVRAACFFFGDAIKEKVAKHFDSAIPHDSEAEKSLLPLDQCRSSIAANDARVQALQEEIDGIDRQLAELQSAMRT